MKNIFLTALLSLSFTGCIHNVKDDYPHAVNLKNMKQSIKFHPNYFQPHIYTNIDQKTLETKLNQFVKRDKWEEAWIYIEYNDNKSIAYEIGIESDESGTCVMPILNEDFEINKEIFNLENVNYMSFYHFHPDSRNKNEVYYPPSMYDVKSFYKIGKFFYENRIEADARVVDRQGTYIISLDPISTIALAIDSDVYYEALIDYREQVFGEQPDYNWGATCYETRDYTECVNNAFDEFLEVVSTTNIDFEYERF